MRAIRLALLLGFAALAPGSALARPSFVLPYLNAPPGAAPIRQPPRLRLSFGGRSVAAVMDTGSTGIVVSADLIPHVGGLPGPAGVLTYSSSGRIMRGRWVRVVARISGADGTTVTTTPIRVLAVTRIACLPHARTCRPVAAPRQVAMLGIGFGRESDHQAESTPDRNPFLNLAAPGAWRGYIVTRDAVRIGLTRDAVRGFSRVQLHRSRSWPDWAQAPACIAVGAAAPACGVALMDTGVVAMYLSVPDLAATLRPGLRLRFLLGGMKPVAGYSLVVGDRADPRAPERIVPAHNRRPFVNTTVRFLNGFDYMFDADHGMVGYRRLR